MNKRSKPEKKHTEEQKRILEAKKDFGKMQEEIAPFIKRRNFKEYSTAGEWCETSSLHNIGKRFEGINEPGTTDY